MTTITVKKKLTTPRQVDRLNRDLRILRLYADGWSEREIARKLGVSRSTVWSVKQANR